MKGEVSLKIENASANWGTDGKAANGRRKREKREVPVRKIGQAVVIGIGSVRLCVQEVHEKVREDVTNRVTGRKGNVRTVLN